MKKFLLSFLVFILIACAPQPPSPDMGEGPGVRETSTPPSTQTPIPTPTFHPAFVEMQTRLADLGLTLLPDGKIQMTADGGRQTVPNLFVSPKGIISLSLADGTMVSVAPEDMSVDEAGGLTVKGYELDENGEWVLAISAEIQSAMAEFDKYTYSTENLEFKQNGDNVWAVDKESGKTVYEKDGDSEYGLFYQFWVVEQAGQLDLMPTDIEPDKTVLEGAGLYFVADRAKAFEYFGPLYKRVRVQFEEEYGYDPYIEGKSGTQRIMIIPEINAWGSVTKLAIEELSFGRYFWYELADGTIHIVPLK
jgi:hypothetical protein